MFQYPLEKSMVAPSSTADPVGPAKDDRDGSLAPLLFVLTVVTGLVDAVSYLALGHIFVANMTGNVVFLGFAVAGAKGLTVWAPCLAIACFAAGAWTETRLGRSTPGGDESRRLARAVTAHAAFVTLALL